MSKQRVLTILATGFILAAMPFAAQAQTFTDAAGVSVDVHGAQLLHRSGVPYPREVATKGVQGTVLVQVKLDDNGAVSDAVVLSGPDELRKGVLQSVLGWHFSKDAAGTTRQVGVTFELTPEARRMAAAGTAVPGVMGGVISREPAGGSMGKIVQIDTAGIPDAARDQLMMQLGVHVGDSVTPETMIKVTQAARQFDEHLNVSTTRRASGEMAIRITAPGAAGALAQRSALASVPGALVVGGRVQWAKLINQPPPVYPVLAKQARIEGVVQFDALIGKDGRIEKLEVVTGHPLLVQAALSAVRDWVYKPTLLNNEPVEVQTTIDVSFTLSQ